MLHCSVQVRDVALVDLGDRLVVLGRDRETAHVGVDVDGVGQAFYCLCKSTV